MTIKNPHIKHLLRKDGKYACIHACNVTPEKVAKNPEEVTCKNCLDILAKFGVDGVLEITYYRKLGFFERLWRRKKYAVTVWKDMPNGTVNMHWYYSNEIPEGSSEK
jgi:hypothetical protein